MRREIHKFIFAFMGYSLLHLGGCAPTQADDDDEDVITSSYEEEEEGPTEAESITQATEQTPCDDESDECVGETTEAPPEEPQELVDDPPILTEAPETPAPPIAAFEPEPPVAPPARVKAQEPNNNINNNPAPAHIAQEDLKLACKKIGSGLTAGFSRYGCNAMTRDGAHYGVVKGWWHVLRRDGSRAKSRDLNFREAGFDMAIDVLDSDARAGIVVRPGRGELPPR